MTTQLLRCDCQHEYQDKKYGKGIRVHNTDKSNKKNVCTVCGKAK